MEIALLEYARVANRVETVIEIRGISEAPIRATLGTDIGCACGTNIECDPEYVSVLVRAGLNEIARQVVALVRAADAAANPKPKRNRRAK